MTCLTSLKDVTRNAPFCLSAKYSAGTFPCHPQFMRQAYRQLASQFPSTLTGPVLFIGMAETAVGLGAGVFDEVRHQHRESVYLTSTRHPVDGTLLLRVQGRTQPRPPII